MSSPPAKRQRTEDASITRSELWNSDGSVVLQAENTQFRVHWSFLARNSAFFCDMQDLPQPPDQPTVEGCPVVELPDAAADVEHLLNALYTPKFLYQPALPFAVLSALVRLGCKYDFRDVLNSAVERITFENPKTLEEFDALGVDGIYLATRIVPYAGLAFDTLKLVRENDILSALPIAYYRAAMCGLDSMLEGIPKPDETSASLVPVDLHRCIRGRERLINAQTRPGYTFGWLQAGLGGFDYEQQCTEGLGMGPCNRVREGLLRKNTKCIMLLALCEFAPGSPKSLCTACRSHAKELLQKGRKKIWDELPGFFDLPPWSELKNDL